MISTSPIEIFFLYFCKNSLQPFELMLCATQASGRLFFHAHLNAFKSQCFNQTLFSRLKDFCLQKKLKPVLEVFRVWHRFQGHGNVLKQVNFSPDIQLLFSLQHNRRSKENAPLRPCLVQSLQFHPAHHPGSKPSDRGVPNTPLPRLAQILLL